MVPYPNDFAFASAGLLVAIRDALNEFPCRQKFSCLRRKRRQGNLRQFIRQCWGMVPLFERPETFNRIQTLRFACDNEYFPQSSWPVFLGNFQEGALLGQALQDQFEDWKMDRARERPAKTLLRIIHGPLSLEAAAYVLEPIDEWEVKNKIGELLLKELLRVCHVVRFLEPGRWNQKLLIQFTRSSPLHERCLVPNFAL